MGANLSEILTKKKVLCYGLCQTLPKGCPRYPLPPLIKLITETTNSPYFTLKFYHNILLLLG